MKNLSNSILIFLLIFLLEACDKSIENVFQFDKLEIAYAQSIKLPADTVDVLVYRPQEVCGTEEEESSGEWIPFFLDELYSSIIKSRYNSIRIVNEDTFDLDSMENNLNKMYVGVWGYRISRDSVKIEETFYYRNFDSAIIIEKYGIFKKGKWEIHTK